MIARNSKGDQSINESIRLTNSQLTINQPCKQSIDQSVHSLIQFSFAPPLDRQLKSAKSTSNTEAAIYAAKFELTEMVFHQVASLTAVLLAMVIYSCFVTLQCMRVTLVKNLMIAILFQEHITLVFQVRVIVVLFYFSSLCYNLE